MTSTEIPRPFVFSFVILIAAAFFCPTVLAQGPLPDAPVPSAQPTAFQPALPPSFERLPAPAAEHKFWDKKNISLFAVSAAFSGADFAVTRSNLQSGGRELNPIVRMMGTSTPALAANFAGETAGMIAISYFLHRTGHHQMERIVSFVNIGSSAGAVSYGLAHR